MELGYLGLDVGTSGCKAAIVTGDGRVLARAHREYEFETPFSGAVELNPFTVWTKVKETLREVAREKVEIRTMAISSIGEALVMIDKFDQVLYNGIVYLDQRGEDTCSQICEVMDKKHLYQIAGVPVNPMYSLNRLLWFQRKNPEILEKATHYFLFGDYIGYRLTGQKAIDPSSASRTMLFDAGKRKWSREIGTAFGIPLERFSEVVPTGQELGKILPSVAEELGLPVNLKVIMGCHDQCSALLGAGAVRTGDIMAGEGSTESINLIIEKKDFSPAFYDNQLCYEPYLDPEQYLIPVGQLSHGISIRWFVEKFGADFGPKEKRFTSIYDQANAGCATEVKDVYFLPYLSRVKSMDAKNRALGTFLGLDVNTGRDVMYRALLEGLCFESRKCIEILERANLPINQIVASGGCSKSELFMQMKADILKKEIRILKEPDAGILGLVIIGATADGYYSDYKEGVETLVHFGRTYCPQKSYEERYRTYRTISDCIQKMYNNL